jgi:hypothetical protein
MRRFFLALLLAPIAGAAAAMLIGVVVVFAIGFNIGLPANRTLASARYFAEFLGFWTYLICLAYTIVLGTAAYMTGIVRKHPPALATALLCSLLLGGLPFSIIALRGETRPIATGAWCFPLLAVAASLVTAWTFWRVALRAATPRPLQPLPAGSSGPASASPGT